LVWHNRIEKKNRFKPSFTSNAKNNQPIII
jgi:hypothetical protein